jgi:hypothetical protein
VLAGGDGSAVPGATRIDHRQQHLVFGPVELELDLIVLGASRVQHGIRD